MKPILVGTFQLGTRMIDVYATDGENGSVHFIPDKGKVTKLNIGIEQSPDDVAKTLVHEAVEAALVDINVRYRPAPAWGDDMTLFSFHMTHAQFDEAVSRAAHLIVKAYPEIMKIHKKKVARI